MWSRWFNLFRPAPAVEPLSDPDEVRRQYAYWRRRILLTSLIGYALFYFVRKNLPLAMPVMEHELGISKSDLGMFLTLHGLLYGLSKFVNGYLGDRANPRYFMALGLALSAAMNVWFGLSSTVMVLGWCWMLNGWFQGMGFPPCARGLTHWFAPSERGTKFAIWNTSHSLGAAAVLILCGMLVVVSWRLCFLVPAALAMLGAVFLVILLRDTPRSLGLPPIEEFADEPLADAAGEGELTGRDFRQFVLRRVLLNPLIWVISLANFFVYTVRYGVLDWGPTFLSETKGIRLEHTGWVTAAYEISGIAGMLVSGWITDKVFHGRAGRACLFSMMLCGLAIFLFWRMPAGHPLWSTVLLCVVGFGIYGPQCLVGVMAANLASRRAAATAIGLTGLFGYLSTALSGWGMGRIVEQHGWSTGFATLAGSAAVATLLFVLAWQVGTGSPVRPQKTPEASPETHL